MSKSSEIASKLPPVSPQLFVLAIWLLHLTAFLQAWFSGGIYLVDSVDYLSQAQNLIGHSSLYAAPWNGPFRFDYFTFRPPVYGVLIALLKFIYPSDYLVLAVQSGFSIATFFTVFRFCREAGLQIGKVRTFLLLTLIFYPSQLIHCNFIMSDILFQFLLMQAFYYTWKLMKLFREGKEIGFRYSWLSALFFALAMLTKPVAFLLGITVLLVLAFYFFRVNKLKLLLPFLLLPLVYHSYCSYNKHITGYYHYSSVTPVFVLKYMAKYTNAQLFGEMYADSVQEVIMKKADAAEHFAQRYEWMNKCGKDIILEHPVQFALFNVKGWFVFMLDPGRFDWVHFLNMDEKGFPGLYHAINTRGIVNGFKEWISEAPLGLISVLIISLIWNALILFLFTSFFINKDAPLILKLLVALFVGYIILSTGVLGLARYRIGIAPLLWISACFIVAGKSKKYV